MYQFFCILHFCHTCSLCRVELVVQFPARGSTQVLLCFFPGVLLLWHFLYSVGQHSVSSLHTGFTLSLCRGHSWRVQLAKQETLTPPRHLDSSLVYRDPWMSTVVLYYWCHSDSASVHLYLTFAFSLRCNIYGYVNDFLFLIFLALVIWCIHINVSIINVLF